MARFKPTARDATTSYAVGSATPGSGGGSVFTDHTVPGVGKIVVMDKGVFLGAARESGKVIGALFDKAILVDAFNVSSRSPKS